MSITDIDPGWLWVFGYAAMSVAGWIGSGRWRRG